MSEKRNILQPKFIAGYGSDCHMKGSGYIPVCVVTDLKNNILIRNMEPKGAPPKWYVTRARVSINRYWTSSNAVIRCTISSEDLSEDFPRVAEDQEIARLLDQNRTVATGSNSSPTPGAPAPPDLPPVAPTLPAPGQPASTVQATPQPIPTAPSNSQRAQPLPTRSNIPAQRAADQAAEQATEGEAQEAARLQSMVSDTKNVKAPLDILDEICVYLGYIDSLRPVTSEDIKAGRLKRVFVGVIDTITVTGTNREGTNLMIQCRDRMKYLMDSLGTFNPADSIELTAPLGLDEGSTDTNTRSNVILTIARRSVGDLRNVKSIEANFQSACDFVGGVGIDPGLVVDFSSPSGGGISQKYNGDPVQIPDLNPYSPYLPNFGLSDPQENFSLSADLSSHKEFPSPIMKFNILTGRPGYEKGDLVSNFQVTDRVPVEFIKYLSLQEPWPTELFAHHQSGEYWYVPRGTDVSGFSDIKRYFRTYFYRRYPSDLNLAGLPSPPHSAQMCLSFREERSALGWRSNIIIGSGAKKASADGGTDSSSMSAVHISVRPSWLAGRVTPTSYYTAVDPSASNVATLGSMALSFARNLGKETKVASARFLGDPTFSPGEGIQVMGSPLNPDPITDKQRKDDVELALTLRDSYKDLALFLAEKIRTVGADEKNLTTPADNKAFKEPASIDEGDPSVIVSTKMLCPSAYGPYQEETTDISRKGDIEFAEEPKSVWRAEGVTHYYNDGETGYFTELSLLSAF
jgi:hypothetical protein